MDGWTEGGRKEGRREGTEGGRGGSPNLLDVKARPDVD